MAFRTPFVTAALLAALAAPAGAMPGGNGHGGPPAPVDCEAARCALQDTIATNCPCDTAANHGSYVRCVAHAVRDAARGGTMPNRCRGKIVRCSARSTCGKSDVVTCQLPVHGDCDTSTGTCKDEASLTCTSEADCVIGTHCKVRSTDECTAAGGTAGPAGSCCAPCPTTTTTSTTSTTLP